MKFLKKLGQLVLNGSEAIPFYGGLIKAFVPDRVDRIIDQVTDKITELSKIVVDVEAITEAVKASGGTVGDKAAVAAPLVAQVFLHSAAFAKYKVKDEALFLQGATKVGGGTADMWNAVEEK